MKKLYIKPVCEKEINLDVVTIIASSARSTGDVDDILYGGKDEGTHDPDVKAENFWE